MTVWLVFSLCCYLAGVALGWHLRGVIARRRVHRVAAAQYAKATGLKR